MPVRRRKNYIYCLQVELETGSVNPNLHGGGFHLYPHIHGTGGGQFLLCHNNFVAFVALCTSCETARNKQK